MLNLTHLVLDRDRQILSVLLILKLSHFGKHNLEKMEVLKIFDSSGKKLIHDSQLVKSIATVSWNIVPMGNPTTGLGGVFLYILHMEQFSEIFCTSSFSSLLFYHGMKILLIKLMSLSSVGCAN